MTKSELARKMEKLHQRSRTMSGISKTIERVKKSEGRYRVNIGTPAEVGTCGEFEREAAKSIMPIITAYEQSQKELEKSNDCLDTIGETHSGLLELYHKTNDELSKAHQDLDTANKRISELEIKFEKQQMYIGLLEQSFSEKVDNETFVSEKEYCIDTVQIRFVKKQTENDDRFLEK